MSNKNSKHDNPLAKFIIPCPKTVGTLTKEKGIQLEKQPPIQKPLANSDTTTKPSKKTTPTTNSESTSTGLEWECKQGKISLKSSERVAQLVKVIPFLSQHISSNSIIEKLSRLNFVSSRALAQVLRLCAQLSEIGKTLENIDHYADDTIDDEVKDVALSASQSTAREICRKLNCTLGKRVRCKEEQEEDDSEDEYSEETDISNESPNEEEEENEQEEQEQLVEEEQEEEGECTDNEND